MKTVLEIFDGVPLIRPAGDWMWPESTFQRFPTYCGAGKIGDTIVPDTIFGLVISPACFIHDQMWTLAPPTWEEFHESNSIFLTNMTSINRVNTRFSLVRVFRQVVINDYYESVSHVGSHHFWSLKENQSAS